MASSLLTTDKRWAAPARKSGMTVLGKIPKPINLPSQRLENHGLDPNVEIVPKGTLTWGSKPNTTTPNAWNSSSLLSPKNDGSSNSPSHFNGRPSSGGGSRPSTAGSESLDSPNAWGSSSRPSTASSTLPTNHLQTVTTRPRSAETRPGSSQLSRFADNSSENMKVSIRTIDKSGSSSHGHGFTLSTGDFPTLGSESNSQRGHSSKGRPTSSSGKEAAQNEQGKSLPAGPTEEILSANSQSVDNIKTEQHVYDHGGAPFPAKSLPNEVQQPQPYPANFCVPPPHFDSWHAPPGHPPDGMWHRGAAPGGPYRPLGPPGGGFPVEPFAYYGQFPPNSEATARQGPGHGGYQPKNGDAYLSMPPNSYMMNQPVIPVRPVYQSPMSYDGYYGPPPRASFNNPNVRDSPFVGGPHQPGILNQFPNQQEKFHPGHPQSRPGKHEVAPNEHLESDRIHVIQRGQPRILHDNLRGPREVERNAQPAPPLLPHPNGNRIDVNRRADIRETFNEKNRVLMKSVPDHRGPADASHLSIPENVHPHPRETDDGTIRKKFKDDNPIIPDQQPVIKKNVALIEKIESLNNKARNVDVRNIAEPLSSKEAKEKQQKSAPSKEVQKQVKLQNVPAGGMAVELSHSELTETTKAGNPGESTRDRPHRRGDSSRSSHHGPVKDRIANNSAGQGLRENSGTDSSPIISLRNSQHDQPPDDALKLEPVMVTDDMPASLDFESQRAKMRELAAQRAKQLQAEEEERTKQQRAKALAKLEELNRRSSVHQKSSNDAPPEIAVVQQKQNAGFDETAKPASLAAESCDVACDSHTALQPPNGPKHTELSVQSKSSTPTHALGVGKDPTVHNSSSSARNSEHEGQKVIAQSHGINVPKPRQGYRRRQAVSEVSEKFPSEKSSAVLSTESGKKIVEALLDTPTAIVTSHDDTLAHNKKSARHSRNKKKSDEAPVTCKHPPVVLNEQDLVKAPSDKVPSEPKMQTSSEPKTHTAGVIISSSIVPSKGTVVTVGSIMVGGISFGSLNQADETDEAHSSSFNSHPRRQQAKKSGKNQQAVRPIERPHGNEGAVWAPVKLPGQSEHSGDAMRKAGVVAPTQPAGQNTNDGENITKTKRAEMERYVPKPLTKELQQQNLEEIIEKSTGGKLETAPEAKKWEGKKTNRGHGKSHPSWRRRNTDESTLVGPNATELSDNYQESHEPQRQTDQHQSLEPDRQEDALASNSSAVAETVTSVVTVTSAKEHGAANRQRRQHVKAQKNEGSNYPTENKDQAAAPPALGIDSNSYERRSMLRSDVKNSGTISQSRAHWKPKTISQSQSNSHEASISQSQSNSHGNIAKDEHVDSATPQDSSSINLAGNSGGDDEKHAHGGEKRHVEDHQKSESHETAEQQLSHAPRRQGNHNGRYHRGGGTNRGRGYDAGKPSHGANTDRRRGGTHLEYQPVGSFSKSTDFQQNPSVDERAEGPPVHRERVHNKGPHPAGQFVKRNPASAPSANAYRDE
ncbi:protein MODIFIER OF SNC1 1 [Oryza brachyantha]|uniref:BAT2 N-terminal domain-containing protein n=1 Tax=Oryza brachyantha TaxID=4533 RepID=J3NE92_ORYBR|nr:protein MODIFIER OF SNC1 1 [Oryza brachyantha]